MSLSLENWNDDDSTVDCLDSGLVETHDVGEVEVEVAHRKVLVNAMEKVRQEVVGKGLVAGFPASRVTETDNGFFLSLLIVSDSCQSDSKEDQRQVEY